MNVRLDNYIKGENLDIEKKVNNLQEIKVGDTKKKVVALKGFLVVYTLPSQRLLERTIPELFEKIPIGTKIIKIARGYFYNRLIYLRNKFTNKLDEIGTYIGTGYIIPPENISKLQKIVDDIKKEYEEYQKQLEMFLLKGEIPPELQEKIEKRGAIIETDYLNIIKNYFEKNGMEFKVEIPNIPDRVNIKLIPFFLDVDLVKDYMGEEVKETIESTIDSVVDDIIKEIREDTKTKLKKILTKLEIYTKRRMTKRNFERLKNEVEQIEKEVESMGIEVTKLPELEEIKNLIDNIETKGYKVDNEDIESVKLSLL